MNGNATTTIGDAPAPATQHGNRRAAIALARATGGALLFSLPMFMTGEMWWIGSYMDPLRLVLLLLLVVPLLVTLSFFAGFEETFSLRDDMVDAFVAYAVGFVTGAISLALLGVLTPGMSAREVIGKVALQAVPGSIGAMLAQSQMRAGTDEQQSPEPGYAGNLFLMAVGALFLAFNLAPTEEVLIVAYRITAWHTLAIAAVSLVLMHAFVYSLQFRGAHPLAPGDTWFGAFLRFTVVGYAMALLVSAYVLWTFGRFDGTAFPVALTATMVLGLPAAVGAAAARLIL